MVFARRLLVASLTSISLMGNRAMSAASSATTTTAVAAAAPAGRELATVAGGCFWCIEAVYNRLKGVDAAISGYTQGHVKDPSYRAVCDGDTGHAEAVQVTFDPAVISYETILKVLFTIHDPTTLNKQGHDEGTQYRSGIYYHSDAQKATAEAVIKELTPLYSSPIVTEVLPAVTFYPAEDYHQGYFAKNPGQGYCRAVVAPKVLKAQTKWGELMK